MSLVDNFTEIRRQLAELEGGACEEPECSGCFGGGWACLGHASGPYFVRCEICHNPKDLPCP